MTHEKCIGDSQNWSHLFTGAEQTGFLLTKLKEVCYRCFLQLDGRPWLLMEPR